MVRARPSWLVATGLVGFVVTLLVLRWAQTRGTLVPAQAVVPVLVGGFAVVVLVLGWRVRQYVRGKSSMDAIAAARVAALAVSAAFVGALMVGVGVAEVVAVVGLADAPAARTDALVGGVTALLAVGLLVAGLVVQAWCRIREDDDETKGPGGPGSPGAPDVPSAPA